jgi:hypothetical protein
MTERLFVRGLVGAALCLTLVAIAVVPIPIDAKGNPDLPAPAFGQTGLYRLEVALMVFYGDPLLITPAFSGLVRGRLPIEISTRGAKFAEGAKHSVKLDEVAVEKLEAAVDDLAQGLADANLRIKRLNETTGRDSTQPEIDSKL